MKHVVFACFAHPDDEAFGPSGTLYKLAHAGADVHLVLITAGDAGRNPDGHADLGVARLQEWQASAKLIGAASTKFLGYKDGMLSNNSYLAIAETLLQHANDTLSGYDDAEVTFITTDPNGISGHIDHIVASLTTTYVYLRLREQDNQQWHLGRLKYACISVTIAAEPNTHWLYMPRGRRPDEIDEISDISDISDKKLTIMKTHHSQREDREWILSRSRDGLSHEYFMYFKD